MISALCKQLDFHGASAPPTPHSWVGQTCFFPTGDKKGDVTRNFRFLSVSNSGGQFQEFSIGAPTRAGNNQLLKPRQAVVESKYPGRRREDEATGEIGKEKTRRTVSVAILAQAYRGTAMVVNLKKRVCDKIWELNGGRVLPAKLSIPDIAPDLAKLDSEDALAVLNHLGYELGRDPACVFDPNEWVRKAVRGLVGSAEYVQVEPVAGEQDQADSWDGFAEASIVPAQVPRELGDVLDGTAELRFAPGQVPRNPGAYSVACASYGRDSDVFLTSDPQPQPPSHSWWGSDDARPRKTQRTWSWQEDDSWQDAASFPTSAIVEKDDAWMSGSSWQDSNSQAWETSDETSWQGAAAAQTQWGSQTQQSQMAAPHTWGAGAWSESSQVQDAAEHQSPARLADHQTLDDGTDSDSTPPKSFKSEPAVAKKMPFAKGAVMQAPTRHDVTLGSHAVTLPEAAGTGWWDNQEAKQEGKQEEEKYPMAAFARDAASGAHKIVQGGEAPPQETKSMIQKSLDSSKKGRVVAPPRTVPPPQHTRELLRPTVTAQQIAGAAEKDAGTPPAAQNLAEGARRKAPANKPPRGSVAACAAFPPTPPRVPPPAGSLAREPQAAERQSSDTNHRSADVPSSLPARPPVLKPTFKGMSPFKAGTGSVSPQVCGQSGVSSTLRTRPETMPMGMKSGQAKKEDDEGGNAAKAMASPGSRERFASGAANATAPLWPALDTPQNPSSGYKARLKFVEAGTPKNYPQPPRERLSAERLRLAEDATPKHFPHPPREPPPSAERLSFAEEATPKKFPHPPLEPPCGWQDAGARAQSSDVASSSTAKPEAIQSAPPIGVSRARWAQRLAEKDYQPEHPERAMESNDVEKWSHDCEDEMSGANGSQHDINPVPSKRLRSRYSQRDAAAESTSVPSTRSGSSSGRTTEARPMTPSEPVDHTAAPSINQHKPAKPHQERYAYCVLLYGKHASYCVEAAVLGMSLRTVRTQPDMVLLHTPDVPKEWLKILKEVGWQPRPVDKLEGKGLYDGSQNNRFDGVFTKLRVLDLEYDKVIMMDADLLVRKNVDFLFNRKAPAALRRHAGADYPDGERIPRDEFFDSKGNLVSGINAGVMILEPSKSDFKEMVDDLAHGKRHRNEASRMPEQDYLSRFYANDWHALGVQFNFQPHQVAFTDRKGLESCTRLNMNYDEEVYIVHFSALPKPRDWLFNDGFACMDRKDFALEELYDHYLDGILKDRRKGYSRLPPSDIRAQLRSVTKVSTREWFQAWDVLVDKIPRLPSMVGEARRSNQKGERRPPAKRKKQFARKKPPPPTTPTPPKSPPRKKIVKEKRDARPAPIGAGPRWRSDASTKLAKRSLRRASSSRERSVMKHGRA